MSPLQRPATPQTFSFIEELRLSDLEIGDERPTVAAPPRLDDEGLPPTLTPEQFNALLPARLPSEFVDLDPSEVEDLVAQDDLDLGSEHDDRTIERYVPPSVEDLDYDSDMTTDMPSEWIDHLASSSRPSDQPPALRSPLPNLPMTSLVAGPAAPTMPLPTLAMPKPPLPTPATTTTPKRPSPPRPNHGPMLTVPRPMMMMPPTTPSPTFARPPEAAATLAAMSVPPPPSSLSPHVTPQSFAPQSQPQQQLQQMQLRSDPIPWNPTPPSSQRGRIEARLPFLLVFGAFVGMIFLMVVLRMILAH